MIWTFMIITSLATTALSKGSVECNLTNPTATTKKCFGKLGAPLIFHLPTSTTKLTLKKDSDIIFKLVDNTDVLDVNHKEGKKMTFFNNGTLKLNKASKEDSGDYVLEIYNSVTGRFLNKINITVQIQAPVSKPAVSQTCLSPEQMMVSCSSEGGGAEIILSLDNNLWIHSGAAETHNVTVSLYGQMTGNLTCDVQNYFSREQMVIQLTSCSSSGSSSGNDCLISLVTVAVRASAAALLLLLSLFLLLGFKYLKSKRSMTVKYDVAEDEIAYSDK
ncbi:uncharacterized protein LOC125021829 [Mugil cephalus]|uniref:uncharacterized protein LOC125021829 n=1 Tax=Mugil cephalus TaxID=48193 RepID=UPI001FB75F1A|nr:uncharacterized protein LOC125021829 [Mugil cephalus]XP_047464009.1 uncharacterized protein LOC125021829 [Mugil cephalus]XP_047464010.1 uncharacterized protein LOC125021829 [Mugil cephalus]XP_047464011.1 uncharacterized protein LOC125021829 [Mugil cephalus]